jgi:membrane protein DedA with SNARE-associated domain
LEVVNTIVEYLSGQAVWWGLFVVMLSAGFEYVFPPFPGDSVTLVAAVLIAAADWPAAGVFAAVMLGSLAGCAFDWWLGHWFASTPDADTWLHRWLRKPTVAERLEAIKSQFRRRGAWYIAANRFVPAFRSLFFVAAGVSGLRLGPVLGWAALSAALWNAAILAVGSAVGYNLDVLVSLLEQYRNAFWVVAGIALASWAIWKIVKHVRGQNDTPEDENQNE